MLIHQKYQVGGWEAGVFISLQGTVELQKVPHLTVPDASREKVLAAGDGA